MRLRQSLMAGSSDLVHAALPVGVGAANRGATPSINSSASHSLESTRVLHSVAGMLFLWSHERTVVMGRPVNATILS